MGKVIFVNRYYKPDHSATSQILTDLAEHLAKAGMSVLVITSRLAYDNGDTRYPARETLNGVQVLRVSTTAFGRGQLFGRAIDYLTFYFSSFIALLRFARLGDTVVAKTDPPLISVLAAIVCKFKRATLVNWLQDLFPEVAQALTVKFIHGPVYKCLQGLRNYSLRAAAKNIVLGEKMRNQLVSQEIPLKNIEVIHNWVVGGNIAPVPNRDNSLRSAWGLEDKFVVGYSGNLGRAHDYVLMLDIIEAIHDQSDIIFLFIGSGAGMKILKEQVAIRNLKNVMFKPYQPLSILSESLSIADIHIISLQPQLEGLIVPSKFYGILAVNKPIVYIGDPRGEVGAQIRKFNLGIVVGRNDSTNATQWILKCHSSEDHLCSYSDRVRATNAKYFSRMSSLNMWTNIIADFAPKFVPPVSKNIDS